MTEDIFTVNHATRAIFGVDSHKKTGGVLQEYNCKKVLAIYDRVILELGIADQVIASIRDTGIQVVGFDGVEPDPTSDMMNRAGNLGRRECVDGVVGIGGGSSLDTAKGANLMLANPGDLEDYIGVNRGKKPIEKRYPLVLLPTTAGTSAEITPVFVVTESKTGLKTGATNRGDVAIVDPLFALGTPPHITASTGIDLLAHVTESLINPKPHWLTDMLDEQVISIVFRYLPVAYQNGGDLEARTQLAFACMTAGYAFADKGTYLGHAVADRISNRFHYPHGVGCAPGLLVALRYAIAAAPHKIHAIARAIGLDGTLSPEEEGRAVLAAYRSLQRNLGLKSMSDMGVDAAFAAFIAKDMPNDVRFRNNPYAPDYTIIAAALNEELEAE